MSDTHFHTVVSYTGEIIELQRATGGPFNNLFLISFEVSQKLVSSIRQWQYKKYCNIRNIVGAPTGSGFHTETVFTAPFTVKKTKKNRICRPARARSIHSSMDSAGVWGGWEK